MSNEICERLDNEGITVTFGQDGTAFRSTKMMEKLCNVKPVHWKALDNDDFFSGIQFAGVVTEGIQSGGQGFEKRVSFSGDRDLLTKLQMCLARSICDHYRARDGESPESHGARQIRMLMYESALREMAHKSLFKHNPDVMNLATTKDGIHFLIASTEKLHELKQTHPIIGHHLDYPTIFDEEIEEDVLKRMLGVNNSKRLAGFANILKAPATVLLDREDHHHIVVYPNMVNEALLSFGDEFLEWLKKKTIHALQNDGCKTASYDNINIVSMYGKDLTVSSPLVENKVVCTLGVIEAVSTVLFFGVYNDIFSRMATKMIMSCETSENTDLKKAVENLMRVLEEGKNDYVIMNSNGTVTDKIGVTTNYQ